VCNQQCRVTYKIPINMDKCLDLIEEMVGSLGTIFDHSCKLCNLIAHRILDAVLKYFHQKF